MSPKSLFGVLRLFVATGLQVSSGSATAAESSSATSGDIIMRDVLVLPPVGRAARSAIHTDALEATLIAGAWRAPAAGESVESSDGTTRTWEHASADTNGAVNGRFSRGGYVYWPVVSSSRRVMLLEANGHNLVYVNGEIRTGDPYSYGYVRLPVLLEPGTNDLLFQCSRGEVRARLTQPSGPVLISAADATLPDLVEGQTEPVWSAAVVLNATTNFQEVTIRALTNGSPENRLSIPPLGTRKAAFVLRLTQAPRTNNYTFEVEARLSSGASKERSQAQLTLRIRRPDQTCKRTFLSAIDDSVQYYAVNPTSGGGTPGQALYLSLHGASVEAIGQADAYSPKRWGPIVCPTNRRPYGFDWEEWGRWDALEVLSLAQGQFHPDPSRIYLTGHSMGGHGTWQLGAIYPDRFAAIGPSAGWVSFTSYVSTNSTAPTNALAALLRRGAGTSETLLMATNYLQEAVYILHGSDDDNVPVTEARHMREILGGFHHDFVYHEQPGVGHWWDVSDEPGADCVDWAPMFDLFAHHAIPSDASLRRIQFVTLNPAVSSRCHWVNIMAQQHSLLPSAVDLQCDPGKRRIVGSTTNVALLRLELPVLTPGDPLTVSLDGQKIENIRWPTPLDSKPALLLSQQDGHWGLTAGFPSADKNPDRSGPFREAFRNHMRFVYATQGTAQEKAWALARARYDAEAFWYRGNGSVSLVADVDYVRTVTHSRGSRPKRTNRALADENVILYGNAECNAAWPVLLGSSPVQVHRGYVAIGKHQIPGNDLACLFLRPMPESNTALVGVIAGTGVPGMKLTERMPYFLSGAGFPDCLVASAEMLTKGTAGLRAAGFFGNNWTVETGDFAWQ